MNSKKFKIAADQIKQLIPSMGSCFASNRITVDGMKVGYMYREQPDNELDSGWRFFSGDETQDYADDPDHFAIYDVNTICNYDAAIISFLESAQGAAFSRVPDTDKFKQEDIDGQQASPAETPLNMSDNPHPNRLTQWILFCASDDAEAQVLAKERDRQIEAGQVQPFSHEDLMARLRQ